MQEKSLTLATENFTASQLFDYKNQIEVKAVFIPLLKTTAAFRNLHFRQQASVGQNPQFSPSPAHMANNRISSRIDDAYAQQRDELKKKSYGQSPEREPTNKRGAS